MAASVEAANPCARAQVRGLLVFYAGLYCNVPEITPPLVTTEVVVRERLPASIGH